MDRAAQEEFRPMLEQLVETMTQPAQRREEIVVENVADAIDLVQRAGDREVALLQIESDFNRLQHVRLALERIAEGTYGTCLACEREIGAKRLRAVPWAVYCVDCQETADRQDKDHSEENQPEMKLKDIA